MATAAGSVKTNPSAKNDAFVESQLERARRRIRTLDLAAALLGFLAGTLAFGLVVAFLDTLFELPAVTRTIAFAGYFIASAVYLGSTVVRPLLWHINPYYAARKVEETLPGAKNSVVNWLDLHDEQLPAAIQQAVSLRAARDMKEADLDRAVSGRRAGWVAAVAGLLVFVFLIMVFSLGARKFFSHLGRAFMPFSLAGPAKRTLITLLEPATGDITISAGQPFNVHVEIGGRIPDQVTLLSGPTPDELERVQLLEADDRDRREWSLLIPGPEVKNGFYYRIEAGDAETETYRVTTRASPAIILDRFTATFKQRAYVGPVVERVQRKQRDLADLRGTQVALEVPTNRELKKGKLDIRTSDGKTKSIPAVIGNNDLSRMRFSFELEQSGTYGIYFETSEGELYSDPLPHQVIARPDKAPEVVLNKPGIDTSLAAHELLEWEGVARDDIGVKETILRMKLFEGQMLQAKPYRSSGELKLADGGYPLVLDCKDFVDLAKVKDAEGKPFELKPGMKLEYWLEAKDACDYPEPNVGESKHFTVVINALPPDQKKDEERKKKAEQDKEKHQKQQDEDLKKENKERQDKAENERNKQEQERKAEEERKAKDKEQQEGKKPDQAKPEDGKQDPDKKGEKGKEDTRTPEQKKQDEKATEDLNKLNEENKKRAEAERDKQKGQGKDEKENRGEGKDDPKKKQEPRDGKNAEPGQNGEAKGKPGDKQEKNQGEAKNGGENGKPDEKRGEGKKEGQPQMGGQEKGAAKDGQQQMGGEQKAEGKGNPPPKDGKDERGQSKGGDKKDGQQPGAQKGNDGMQGDKDAAKPKDGGGMQGGAKDAGQGKGEPKQQPRAEGKGGKEQGQPQASGKGGPKDGDPMAGKTGTEKGGAKDGEQKTSSAKDDRIQGEPKRPEQKEQTPPEFARKTDVDKAAEDLKSSNAGDREEARQRLEQIAKKSQDGDAREQAQKELDKERKGENAGAPKQSAEGKKDGKTTGECKGGGQGGGQAAGKEGGQQPGQSQAKGGQPDPNKRNQGPGSGKGNGDVDPRQAKDEINKLERAVQGAKDGDGKKREASKEEIKEAFDKLIQDLKSNDPVRREQAREVLKELQRQQRQDKEFDKGLPQDKVNEAKEEAKKNGGAGDTGTGGTARQGDINDPTKPATSPSDNRHRNQAGDLTLDKFNDIVKKKQLPQTGDWTEERIDNVRRHLKEKEDQAKKDGGRAPLGVGKSLGTTGIDEIKGGDTKVKPVGQSDQGQPPLEYRDFYKEFTKKLQEATKDK